MDWVFTFLVLEISTTKMPFNQVLYWALFFWRVWWASLNFHDYSYTEIVQDLVFQLSLVLSSLQNHVCWVMPPCLALVWAKVLKSSLGIMAHLRMAPCNLSDWTPWLDGLMGPWRILSWLVKRFLFDWVPYSGPAVLWWQNILLPVL